jgi:tagaturonate epimerase
VLLQTIAPKFTGRFNKGVDYVGDADAFAVEFEQDVYVLRAASEHFGLPQNLKLSVHSGSDKFTLYPIIQRVLRQTGAGLHLKTAGTTWLEELIGLAHSGTQGIVLEIYARAYDRFDELVGPYATVLDVQRTNLPLPEDTAKWTGARWAAALTHEPQHPEFHSQLRQFMHVSYKVAAELGESYLRALDEHSAVIGKGVTDNLYRRHMLPLFSGLQMQGSNVGVEHNVAV